MDANEPKQDSPFIEMSFFAFFGAVTGAIYGLVLAGLSAAFFTGEFSPSIVKWTTLLFGIVGVFSGNVIAEAFLGLLHFLWGLFNGMMDEADCGAERVKEPFMRALTIVGIVTGLALLLTYGW